MKKNVIHYTGSVAYERGRMLHCRGGSSSTNPVCKTHVILARTTLFREQVTCRQCRKLIELSLRYKAKRGFEDIKQYIRSISREDMGVSRVDIAAAVGSLGLLLSDR